MAERTLLAGFSTAADLAEVVRSLQDHNLRYPHQVQVAGPNHNEDIREALGLAPSRLPFWAGVGGLLSAATAFAIQQGVQLDYPVRVGGFGLWRFWPYIPLTFVGGILGTAVAGFVGLWSVEHWPDLANDAAGEELMRRVSAGFWVLRVDSATIDEQVVQERLQDLDALWIDWLGEEER